MSDIGRGGGNVVGARICSTQDCKNVLAKGTRGKQCRKCYSKNPAQHNEENDPLKVFEDNQQLFDSINIDMMNDMAGQLKMGDLIVIIRKEISPLINIIKGLQERVTSLETRIGN